MITKTPPSRFVRVTVFTASCGLLETSIDAVFNSFRILDDCNIPLGAQVPKEHLPTDIVRATQASYISDI
jgi:choloylglycine hydrolase